jgi:broad specificity phosphatase PhoE
MIIDLMRHFPVDFNFSKWSDSETFNQDMNSYNNAPVCPMKHRTHNQQWDTCFSSTMKRAVDTAKLIFNRDHIQTDQLREVPLVAGFKIPVKIPVFLWAVIGRLQWLFNSKHQPETRKQSSQRAHSIVSYTCLKAERNHKFLFVTHGFFMLCIRSELLRFGFRGPRLFHVKNGRLYRFEKNPDPTIIKSGDETEVMVSTPDE